MVNYLIKTKSLLCINNQLSIFKNVSKAVTPMLVFFLLCNVCLLYVIYRIEVF